jgi:deoxyribonuclease-4
VILGAHQSIAGGLDRAFALAREDRCHAIQIFTKNKGAWADPVRTKDEIARFRDARAASGLGDAPVLAHGSYLANLCAKDPIILEKSRMSLLAEVLRCESLGIDHVVFHPGAHLGVGIEAGIARVAEEMAWVLARSRGAKTSLLVENTAGAGTCIASKFEELGAILAAVDAMVPSATARVGVCIDTCHTFAAGYDLRGKKGYESAIASLDRHVGLDRVRALHLNDSKGALGSRLDRHARYGEGELGPYPFFRLVNEPRLARAVGVIETAPVVREDGKPDRFFAQQLRALRAHEGKKTPRRA